jgi:hypothetical protein
MNVRHMDLKVFLGLGIITSIGGAVFAWFAYGVFANGDCNPCPQPPLWVWLPLLLGVLFVAFGLVLRLRSQNATRINLDTKGEADA